MTMTGDDHYRDKLRHRGRGVLDLERRVGGISAEIEDRLDRQDVVRVLELGCGYGTALLELRARFGHRAQLHGLNRLEGDGNPEILRRNARERGLALDATDLPSIAYGDIAAGLPFPDDCFDLVYSQVAWLYFGNKIGVVREVIRVLRHGGLAKIDADEVREGLPAEYGRLVEIWNAGELLPFGEYARRYGMAFTPAPDGEYLRFGKVAGFGDDLQPLLEIDVSALHAHWDGVKCVYRVRPAAAGPATHDRVAGGDPGT
jgi:SAM-dependent methyltransferase